MEKKYWKSLEEQANLPSLPFGETKIFTSFALRGNEIQLKTHIKIKPRAETRLIFIVQRFCWFII